MEQNSQNTALLILDMQIGILGMLPAKEPLISNVARAIAAAREKQIQVIYITVGFRPGAPEINMNNKSFAGGKERFGSMDMNEFTTVSPELAPLPGELSIMKRRVSAFTGNDLEMVLKASGIQHLVLTGVATSGAVLSTLREAADKDYRLTVIPECCADLDEEVHRVLTTKVFPRQSDVIALEDWIK